MIIHDSLACEKGRINNVRIYNIFIIRSLSWLDIGKSKCMVQSMGILGDCTTDINIYCWDSISIKEKPMNKLKTVIGFGGNHVSRKRV